ncbi:hypothetical protein ACFL6S_33595 [Candidatus Poribacteria bacterium]
MIGKILAVATSSGIYLYDLFTHAEIRFLETGAWMNSSAFSPDGELLPVVAHLSARYDHGICI